MTQTYYVNRHAQTNGDHEIHTETCPYLPAQANRMFLGAFNSCVNAVSVAKLTYTRADGCKTCCPACHTR